ncbi:hypothetical protein [Burkholderia sp. MSMB0856]|uniref:hypothetical protein n=1 Tax=Burkholderia sp. MSMB0856 TaxID=1637869 RepID=UPI00131EFFCE|nr:hypothetical protein [Burkholderia sp. MSMB0856]
MTVSSEGRKVPSSGCASVRAFFRGHLAGRRPDADARRRASGSFWHGENHAFMPIADLIDSGIGSIRGVDTSLFTRVILTTNLYPDKNSVIPISAHGRPR